MSLLLKAMCIVQMVLCYVLRRDFMKNNFNLLFYIIYTISKSNKIFSCHIKLITNSFEDWFFVGTPLYLLQDLLQYSVWSYSIYESLVLYDLDRGQESAKIQKGIKLH